MSSVELREAVLVCPRWARSLLTVRAAISFARLVDIPWSRSLSTMCSYLRSCLSVHSARGTRSTSMHRRLLDVGPHRGDDPRRLVERRAPLHQPLDPVDEIGVVSVQPRGADDARGEVRAVSQLFEALGLPVLHPRLLGCIGLEAPRPARLGVAW